MFSNINLIYDLLSWKPANFLLAQDKSGMYLDNFEETLFCLYHSINLYFMCYIRHLRPCLPNQILRCDPDLQAPLSGAYINMVELFGGVVDVGREMLFHADGGAAATDVAGEGEEFFDRDHFTAFVAGDLIGRAHVWTPVT